MTTNLTNFWTLVGITAALFSGCIGEPFTGFSDVTISQAGQQNEGSTASSVAGRTSMVAGAPMVELPIGGDGGMVGSSSGAPSVMGGKGGQPITEAGSGGTEEESWGCRIDEKLCQCYADPSQFEPGWLTLGNCSPSSLCTNRDDVACVCWGSETDYQNALKIEGTRAVKGCP